MTPAARLVNQLREFAPVVGMPGVILVGSDDLAAVLAELAQTKKLLDVAKCPACDGSGAYEVQTGLAEYVTRDMAVDAGQPEREGEQCRPDSFDLVQCQWCAERAELAKVRP